MIDRPAFLEQYNSRFPEAPLDMAAAGHLWVFLDMLRADKAMSDVRFQAYCLATARHETGADFRCRAEKGLVSYFAKYEPGTPLGRKLGNTEPGDGYRFRGRGYVQITGRSHYERFSRLVNRDLIAAPGNALEPSLAYRIMSLGMVRGLFTGKKLADYIRNGSADYVSARRIVNGQDKAAVIAGYAMKLREILALSA